MNNVIFSNSIIKLEEIWRSFKYGKKLDENICNRKIKEFSEYYTKNKVFLSYEELSKLNELIEIVNSTIGRHYSGLKIPL